MVVVDVEMEVDVVVVVLVLGVVVVVVVVPPPPGALGHLPPAAGTSPCFMCALAWAFEDTLIST